MRSLVDGLETPHPLGLALPGVFQEDPLIQRFLTAFDDVLAPIFNTLDNLEAYFDPQLTPPDFLPWLAGWVGASLDDNWPVARQRELTARAANLYRWRGTIKGLAAEVALFTGSEPEVIESGACIWSSLPGTRTPGSGEAHVRIRVRVPDPAAINETRLRNMIVAAIPADVVYDLEILPEAGPAATEAAPPAPAPSASPGAPAEPAEPDGGEPS